MAEFYDHLPRVALFVQDDPEIGLILQVQRLPRWIEQLESSVEERAAVGGSLRHHNQPWSPTPCGCRLIREKFSRDSYGGYSPIHWWMRSFLVPYANGSVELPSQISWPSMAQFMMPRTALRRRSRRFAELNVRLTEIPAPLKANVPRNPKENDAAHHRSSKWANFGPQIVDFGEPPRPNPPGAWGDTRPGINGMDFAQLYERSWFLAFDPALKEHAPGPAHPLCLSRESMARSPMRCAAPACPYPHGRAKSNDDEGGCASSDEIGATRAPPRWRFGPSKTAALALAPVAATAIAAPVAAVTATVVAAAAPPCCEHCQRNHILFRVWLELDRTTVFATGVLCLPVQPVHDHGSL